MTGARSIGLSGVSLTTSTVTRLFDTSTDLEVLYIPYTRGLRVEYVLFYTVGLHFYSLVINFKFKKIVQQDIRSKRDEKKTSRGFLVIQKSLVGTCLNKFFN